MYYVLKCMPPIGFDHYTLKVPQRVRNKRWPAGVLFSEQDERPGFHPPPEPIEITTVPEAEVPPNIYGELYWIPIPLMSRRLVAALRAAGVDNLQTFETTLVTLEGKNPPPKDHYLAVNIVGLVEAADLGKSEINPDVPERMIATDFDSLAVDTSKAKDLAMFRLAENVSAVLVHERVKNHVEAAGITTLRWMVPAEWAG
jgi:hypothetical protein